MERKRKQVNQEFPELPVLPELTTGWRLKLVALKIVLKKRAQEFKKMLAWGIVFVAMIFLIFQMIDVDHEYNIRNHYNTEYKVKYDWLSYDLYKKIRQKTREYDVPTNWVIAMYDAESEGNRYAVSVSKARGIGQVMAFHLPEDLKNHPEVLFDIDFNIDLSIRIFRDCLIRYDYDLVKALNAYERGNKRSDINVWYLSKIVRNIGVNIDKK